MKRLSEALFESIDRGVGEFSRGTASKVRGLVGAEHLTVEQHKELDAILREGMESVVWHLLGRLDNVGCSLPDDVRGYRLLGIPSIGPDVQETDDDEIEEHAEDISDGFADYCDLWLDYLHHKRESRT